MKNYLQVNRALAAKKNFNFNCLQGSSTLKRVGLVLALCLMTITQVWADKTIYFRPSAEWKKDKAWFQIWDGYNNNVASLTGVDGVFKVTLSDWATNVTLKRMQPDVDPENIWNQYNIDVTTNNYFYNSGWGDFTALTTTGVVEGGYIYFDNSKTQWTGNIQFVVGRAAYSRTYEMTQISNTKIWYVDLGSKSNHEWADATYYAFISSGSKFDDGEWGPSNVSNATGYTATYTGKYSINSGGSYWCVPSAGANGSSFEITYKSGYGSIPANNTKIQVKVKENGAANYSNGSTSNKPATTIRVQGTYLSGNGASTRSYETWTSGSETNNYGSVNRGKVSPEYSSLGSNWHFDGWYKSDELQSTAATYDFYQPSSNVTIEARFTKKYTVTYNANSSSSGSIPAVSGTAYLSGTDVTLAINTGSLAKTGYELTGWNTRSDGCGTHYDLGATLSSISSNQTLHAEWVAVHKPGIYVTASGSGGYGKTLKTYSDELYEWYGVYKSSGNNKILADQTSPGSDPSGANVLGNFTSGNYTSSGWLASNPSGNTSSSNSASAEFPACNHGIQLSTTNNVVYMVVKGYTQLGIYASDGETVRSKNKYLKVVVDGYDVTTSQSSGKPGVRHYSLTSGQHIIRLSGATAAGNNYVWAFSLKPAGPSVSGPSSSAAEYTIGDTPTPLEVSATAIGTIGTFTYQWYSNTTASNSGGTIITDSTRSSFIPPTTSAGTTYYYCVVSETGCNSTTSSVSGAITVNEAACSAPTSPSISGTTAYSAGDNIELTASATGTDGSTTYQWYKGDPGNGGVSQGDASTSGATFTKNSCVTGDAGTYYCVISNGEDCDVTTYQAITVACLTAPSAVTSLTNSAHTTTSLTYTWTKASNASGYVATLYSDEDCEVSVEAKALGDVATATFTGLTPNATYYCKVQSKGNGTVYCEDGGTTSKVSGTTDAPSVGTFTPASGSTVKSGTTVTVTGSTSSTVYYLWGTSSAPANAAAVVSSGTAGTSGAATVTTTGISSSNTYLYAVAVEGGVNSVISSASYTIDDTAPTLSSSDPANSATGVNTSGTIVLTFSEALSTVDGTKFTLTNATKGAVAIDGSNNTKVNIAYSGASYSTTVTLATPAGAVTDAVGNTSAALSSISFTTKAEPTLTALEEGTLYTAQDMASDECGTLSGTSCYSSGLSSNTMFKVIGDASKTDQTGGTPESKTCDKVTLNGNDFTTVMWLKGQANLSSKIPEDRALKFMLPKAGSLTIYYRDNNDSKAAVNLAKSGSDPCWESGSKGNHFETKTGLSDGTYYIYADKGSTAIYGLYYDKAPEFSSSTPANGDEDVEVEGTIVLTFDEEIASVDDSKFTLDGATLGTVGIDGSDATKVNVAYSDADGESTVTLSVAAGAVTDAAGNTNAALSDIAFTTEETCTKPGKPTGPRVEDGTLKHKGATFSWDRVGATANYDGYMVSIAKVSDGSTVLDWTDEGINLDGDAPLYDASGLMPATAYYFIVKAKGADGYCEYGDTARVQFTTNNAQITYVYNGATGGASPATATGGQVTLPTPTRTNYDFDGWYVGSTKIGDAGDTYALPDTIKAYAKWKKECAGGVDPVVIKLFDGSEDTDFASSPITVSGVSLTYTAYDKANDATDVSSKTNNVNSKHYAKGYQFSNSEIDNKGNNRKCIGFTIPSGYTATFTHAFGASGNSRTIMLGSAVVTSASDDGYIATLATLPSSGGSSNINGGTYSSSLSAGTYYICGAGGGWQVVELIFTLTPTSGGGGSCRYITYDGNGADAGFVHDSLAYPKDTTIWLKPSYASTGYTRKGYEFNGWCNKPEPDEESTLYDAWDDFDLTQDTTLYARWKMVIDKDNTDFEGYDSPTEYKDVRVTNGATLTISDTMAVKNITVESGATLNIAANKDDAEKGVIFTVNSLSLEGGWTRINKKDVYDMPRVYINPSSKLVKTVSTVNFDVAVDNRNFYPIALPYEVDYENVNYKRTDIATYLNDYYLKYKYLAVRTYNGANRARYGSYGANWDLIYSGTLKPGTGYILRAVPARGDDYAVIRFPMVVDNKWTEGGEKGSIVVAEETITKNVVEVPAYQKPEGETPKSNKGWNLLGIPYMSCFQTGAEMYDEDNVDDPATLLKGHLVISTGKWVDDNIRYVTIPNHDFSEYIQVNIEDEETVLMPGWCFFVQVEDSGNLVFLADKEAESSGIPYYAPRRANAPMPTVKTGIILSNGTASDKTTILVSDKYSAEEYEINADLEKMFGENSYTLATYSLMGETRMAYNAMSNADIMNVIPIGYRAPADGEYTFSINPRYAESEAFERVDLIDYEEGIITDLLLYSYTFATERTQNDTRFALNVVKKQPEVTTDIEATDDEQSSASVKKVIINDKLFIIRDGAMYDATGKRVKGGR